MDELQAFLQAMHEQPEDEVTRLVFADWLQDRDDPRAEYIRAAHEWMLADREVSVCFPSRQMLENCWVAWSVMQKLFFRLISSQLQKYAKQTIRGTMFCGFPESVELNIEELPNFVSDPTTHLIRDLKLYLTPNYQIPTRLNSVVFPVLQSVRIWPTLWNRSPKGSRIDPMPLRDWLSQPEFDKVSYLEVGIRDLEQSLTWFSEFQPPPSWQGKTIRVQTSSRGYHMMGVPLETRQSWCDRFANTELGQLVSTENHELIRTHYCTNVTSPYTPPPKAPVQPNDFFRIGKSTWVLNTWASPAEESLGTMRARKEYLERLQETERKAKLTARPDADPGILPDTDQVFAHGRHRDWRSVRKKKNRQKHQAARS